MKAQLNLSAVLRNNRLDLERAESGLNGTTKTIINFDRFAGKLASCPARHHALPLSYSPWHGTDRPGNSFAAPGALRHILRRGENIRQLRQLSYTSNMARPATALYVLTAWLRYGAVLCEAYSNVGIAFSLQAKEQRTLLSPAL